MQKEADMVKEAAPWGKILKGLGIGGTTVGLPLGMDYAMNAGNNPDFVFGKTTIEDLINGNMTPWRKTNLFLNAGIGGLGSGLMSKGETIKGLETMLLAPGKDLIVSAIGTTGKANQALDTFTENSDKLTKDVAQSKWLAGALGAGALGLGAIGLLKYLSRKDPKAEMGRLKLKLPGKDGEPDTDAEVELPIDMPNMSNSLIEGLNMGVRRQARKNVKANSFKRDLETGKLIPLEEWEAKYGDPKLLNKEASVHTSRAISLVEAMMRETMPDAFEKDAGMAPPPPPPPPSPAPAPAAAPAPTAGPAQPPPPQLPGNVAARRPVQGTPPPAPSARYQQDLERAPENTRKTIGKLYRYLNKTHLFNQPRPQ